MAADGDSFGNLLNLEALYGCVYESGRFRVARRGYRDVVEPATGEPLTRVGMADAADVQRAVKLAAAAQSAWADVPARERADLLVRAAGIFRRHHEELARVVERETGGTLAKGEHEVREAGTLCQIASSLPLSPTGGVLPSLDSGCSSLAYRVPHGVVGVISPFNFPLILSLRSVAPALALGNAVVLKPDPRTPISGGLLIARVLEEAGLPPDLLQVLPGDAAAGEALVTDPRVPMIAFTGSPRAGRAVASLAGQHLKKVVLELGGSNSLVILEDADLDLAAGAAAWGAWLHQGQICMASNRIFVHESIEKEIRERLVTKARRLVVGDGATGRGALGPMIDEGQLQRLHAIVCDSVQAGAVLETGGCFQRLFYEPTVLSGVRPGMRVFDEEPFGPVASLVTFRTDAEAVELANQGEGGLAAGVISQVDGSGFGHRPPPARGDVAHQRPDRERPRRQPVRRPRHRGQRQQHGRPRRYRNLHPVAVADPARSSAALSLLTGREVCARCPRATGDVGAMKKREVHANSSRCRGSHDARS